MQKILISACLVGEAVRYDGKIKTVKDERLLKWRNAGRLVLLCPEVEGGLAVPRPPAEIAAGSGEDVLTGQARVVNVENVDVTHAFVQGARTALEVVKRLGIRVAVLKERSPSCGSHIIYDGTFCGKRIPGRGVTTALLRRNGVTVFSEEQIREAFEFIKPRP